MRAAVTLELWFLQEEKSMSDIFSITDLACENNVTTRTIRFYEAEGLLHPERRGRTRLFCQRDRTRLKLILRGKRLGFSLAEIAEIVNLYDEAPGEAGQLRHFLDKISERRAELKQKQRDISVTLSDLALVEKTCLERLLDLEAVS